jgi:DNA-directed RNA polymerase specialized sigma24 family protein
MRTDAKRSFAERFLCDQHRLYGYIATLVPSRADAEDIFQETSLLLWEKWCEFDQDRDLMPWACGIAHNVVRNFWRTRQLALARLLETPPLAIRSGSAGGHAAPLGGVLFSRIAVGKCDRREWSPRS